MVLSLQYLYELTEYGGGFLVRPIVVKMQMPGAAGSLYHPLSTEDIGTMSVMVADVQPQLAY